MSSTKDSFSIGYKKIALPNKQDLETLIMTETSESNYNPFKINNLQNYNPIYSEIFELNKKNFNSISLNQKKQFIFDIQTTQENSVKYDECFIKYSPLLDPFRYLTGKYDVKDTSLKVLPKIREKSNDSTDSFHKLIDPNNASYIDNFFCYLVSQLKNHHEFINGIDYYGSFLGIQERFRVNIADDMDYLRNSQDFLTNKDILYDIDILEDDPFANFGSRKNKDKLVFHNQSNISHFSVEDLDSIDNTNESINNNEVNNDIEKIYENEESDDDSSNDSETNYTSDEEDGEDHEEDDDDNSAIDQDEDEDDEDEEENDEEDEDDEEEEDDSAIDENDDENDDDIPIYAYIHDFPIQLICLEPCKNTIDSLFQSGELDEKTAAAALMQIIMSLLVFQKCFHFTHNDLHTNNIMYIETEEEYLYYQFNNKIYKVPTYGKLYKIIDFGRAIYKFQGRTYCSDSFSPEGDANSQYNCEPYLNEKKPRLEPNYSFDLCRLGCSIFDFILDEDYLEQDDSEEIDDLQRTVIRWCSDDNSKNVLYKKSGEERYPNFKLYKMIARTVHNHTPEAQLDDPYFSQFALSDKKSKIINSEKIIDIDNLPCYI